MSAAVVGLCVHWPFLFIRDYSREATLQKNHIRASSVARPIVSSGGHWDNSAETFFRSFLRSAVVNSSSMGRGVYCLTLSVQRLLCRSRHRPLAQVAVKEGFGEAVVVRNVHQPHEFPSLDSCQKFPCWPSMKLNFPHTHFWSCAPTRRCGEVSFGTRIRLLEFTSRVHVSQQWVRIETTKELYNLNMFSELTALLRKILLSWPSLPMLRRS